MELQYHKINLICAKRRQTRGRQPDRYICTPHKTPKQKSLSVLRCRTRLIPKQQTVFSLSYKCCWFPSSFFVPLLYNNHVLTFTVLFLRYFLINWFLFREVCFFSICSIVSAASHCKGCCPLCLCRSLTDCPTHLLLWKLLSAGSLSLELWRTGGGTVSHTAWSAVTEGATHDKPNPLPRWKCVLVLLGRGLAVLADASYRVG